MSSKVLLKDIKKVFKYSWRRKEKLKFKRKRMHHKDWLDLLDEYVR